jgi:predicted GIY-YIG superfamily endonuclease
MTYRPGDTVLLETARTAKHYGYALLADDDVVFYVGRTCDPAGRLRSHVYSGSSLIRAKLQENKLQRLRILAGPMSKQDAGEWEKATIREMRLAGVQLVNQEHQPVKAGNQPRHPAVLRFAGLPPDAES